MKTLSAIIASYLIGASLVAFGAVLIGIAKDLLDKRKKRT